MIDEPQRFTLEQTSVPDNASNPDLLRDQLTGQQVLVAGHRRGRPQGAESSCPFCPGGLEAPEPYQVRAFPNRWPALPGASEVLLYTSDHSRHLPQLTWQEIRRVIDLWAERTEQLVRRADVGYVLIFENRGSEAGATIEHPHGQIFAFSEVPDLPARELSESECVLCGHQPPGNLVVSVSGGWRAWVPEAAAWPFELRIAPGDHVPDLPALDPRQRDDMARVLQDAFGRLERVAGHGMPSLMWIHQRPSRGDWPQAHLHLHVAGLWQSPGRRRHIAAGEHGSGVMVNPVQPVLAARLLREADQRVVV